MTIWDWVRSGIIFTAAIFIFNNFFISLTILESIILALYLGVAMFHIIDIHAELHKRLHNYRMKRDGGDSSGLG